MATRRRKMPPPYRARRNPADRADIHSTILAAQVSGLADGSMVRCPQCGQVKAAGAALEAHLRSHG